MLRRTPPDWPVERTWSVPLAESSSVEFELACVHHVPTGLTPFCASSSMAYELVVPGTLRQRRVVAPSRFTGFGSVLLGRGTWSQLVQYELSCASRNM